MVEWAESRGLYVATEVSLRPGSVLAGTGAGRLAVELGASDTVFKVGFKKPLWSLYLIGEMSFCFFGDTRPIVLIGDTGLVNFSGADLS